MIGPHSPGCVVGLIAAAAFIAGFLVCALAPLLVW
jgi:hypothetical protein